MAWSGFARNGLVDHIWTSYLGDFGQRLVPADTAELDALLLVSWAPDTGKYVCILFMYTGTLYIAILC